MSFDRKAILATAALVLLMLIVFLPASPALRPLPTRDSGVFLYIGEAMLRGERLYADVWDHKPPVIYAVNALGVLLTGQSMWGVWLIEAAFLGGAVIFSVLALRRAFGLAPAIFATFAWIAAFSLMIAGNQLEEYGLLFQFAALYFAFRSDEHPVRDGFLAGLALGLLALVRPNLVGVGVGIGAYLAARALFDGGTFHARARLIALVVGGALVLLVTAALFVLGGTFNDFWEAAFGYNFLYGSSTLQDKFSALSYGLEYLAESGLPLLAIAAWLATLGGLALRRVRFFDLHPLVAVALIAFPLELLLASLSGRRYEHYYVVWLPVFAALAAVVARLFMHASEAAEGKAIPARIWLAGLALAVVVTPGVKFAQEVDRLLPVPESTGMDRLVAFLHENTTEADSVLVWGAMPSVNFFSERRAPSRFIYQAPLYMPGFQSVERYQAFVDELRADPPLIVFDTSPTDRGIPPLDAGRRAAWQADIIQNPGLRSEWDDINIPLEMDLIFDYLAANYEHIGRIVGWEVYRRRD